MELKIGKTTMDVTQIANLDSYTNPKSGTSAADAIAKIRSQGHAIVSFEYQGLNTGDFSKQCREALGAEFAAVLAHADDGLRYKSSNKAKDAWLKAHGLAKPKPGSKPGKGVEESDN